MDGWGVSFGVSEGILLATAAVVVAGALFILIYVIKRIRTLNKEK